MLDGFSFEDWEKLFNIHLLPLPMVTGVLFILIWRDLHRGREYRPFFLSLGVFLMGYIGLGISLWPWLVPFQITFRQAAAAATSQSLLLVGTVIVLPLVLIYTAFCSEKFFHAAWAQGVIATS